MSSPGHQLVMFIYGAHVAASMGSVGIRAVYYRCGGERLTLASGIFASLFEWGSTRLPLDRTSALG